MQLHLFINIWLILIIYRLFIKFLPGSYTCACDSGYSGSGYDCFDIDECETDPCGQNATCENLVGSFSCTCNSGYTGDGLTCNDVDECFSNPCDSNATCENSDGMLFMFLFKF